MLEIKYRRARTLAEAIELSVKTKGPARYLAGGTDLIVKSKAGKPVNGTWIDVSRVPELAGIEDRGDHVLVGGNTPYFELERSKLVQEEFVALWQAVKEVGSPQIRALGTLGGNIANASPAADGVPPLYAFGASVLVVGPNGERRIAADDFTLGPGKCVLEPGEIVRAFELPRQAHHRSIFFKLGPRRSLAISKVNLAMALEMKDGCINDVRIGLGAVGPTVLRAPRAEGFLTGKRPTLDVCMEACRLARTEVHPISDFRSTAEYRREMAGTLVLRALTELTGTPPGS
jgi:xanthine dehydrogenase FAD-binding subunit